MGKISPNNTRIMLTVNKDIKEKLEEIATNERRSLSNFINLILENYLKELEDQK